MAIVRIALLEAAITAAHLAAQTHVHFGTMYKKSACKYPIAPWLSLNDGKADRRTTIYFAFEEACIASPRRGSACKCSCNAAAIDPGAHRIT
jgi:hypothetical protein